MKAEILRLLRETDGYVSGQELCNQFGVSRTAVWKAINQLKEAGYEIEAVQNKGYHLVSVPDRMDEVELASIRKTEWAGAETYYFDKIDSTNTKAKELAEEGHPSGTFVVADQQTAGKGRRGRSWDSLPGTGIYMTLMLKPDINPNHASMLTLVTAMAVANAMHRVTGAEALIKWPNDIVINGKKICGILTEMSAQFDYTADPAGDQTACHRSGGFGHPHPVLYSGDDVGVDLSRDHQSDQEIRGCHAEYQGGKP